MIKLNFKQLVYCFTSFAIALCVFRVFKTNQFSYLFLVWNLFLALIPWWISEYLKTRNKLQLMHLPLLFAWLLFLPNAPYILTDLFHLRQRADIPLWFDLVLILSFAFMGLVVFMKSLKDMLSLLRNYLSPVYFAVAIPVIFWLISFGLYLGRFMRFNSWDIIHPFRLAKISIGILFEKDTIEFTCIFSVFMCFLYFITLRLSEHEKL